MASLCAFDKKRRMVAEEACKKNLQPWGVKQTLTTSVQMPPSSTGCDESNQLTSLRKGVATAAGHRARKNQ